MSGYSVTQFANGTADVKLTGVTVLGVETTNPELSDDTVIVGMSKAAFEQLTGHKVREYLRKSLNDAQTEIQRLSDDRDKWQERAEGGLSEAGRSSLGTLFRAFSDERTTYRDPADRKTIDRLQHAAEAAVYRENERGGHARRVVAEVARVLGVDIDEGPGHRWDPEHMARVIAVANRIREERDEAVEQVALWKALAERQDNTAPIRMELSSVKRERDEWRRKYEGAQANAEYVRDEYTPPDEAAQMKAAIVRQAREISLLRGESE